MTIAENTNNICVLHDSQFTDLSSGKPFLITKLPVFTRNTSRLVLKTEKLERRKNVGKFII